MPVDQIGSEGRAGTEHEHCVIEVNICGPFVQQSMADAVLIVCISVQFTETVL